MEIARQTDLPDLLTSLGYQVTRVGNYHSTKEMDSLRIKDRRTWRRYSDQSGGDAIAFLQHFQGMSFQEAVKCLLAFHGRARDPPRAPATSQNPKKEKQLFQLPEPSADHRRVFAYLCKRGIAPQVIRAFLFSGLLYEDAKHHNCVFVGKDSSGQPVFANQRGTYDLNGSGFKGDVVSSDKSIGFRLPCALENDTVFVFEAPIDLMSYCTLHRAVKSNALALCCLHDGALETYLKEHAHLKQIVLCLDADEPGRKAAERIKTEYTLKGYAVSMQSPAHGKDWNEYLQHHKKQRERGR
jgi:hypothetical protein